MKHTDSPSNRLYRGEITDFRDAMHAVQGECTIEMGYFSGDKELDEKSDSGLQEFSRQANQALAIYVAQVQAAEKCAIEQMRAAGLSEFADALESGDYSGLAI